MSEKTKDVSRLAVIEHGEVAGLEARDRPAGRVRHDNINLN